MKQASCRESLRCGKSQGYQQDLESADAADRS
jgi:hypothetical protein